MFKYVVLYYFCCTLIIEGYVDYRLHKNWPKDMEKICGENFQDRIIGGKYAKLGQYPWLVQLVFQLSSGKLAFMCGGSLITRSHVISAGHCVASPDTMKLHHVVVGEYNTKTDPDCEDDVCAAPVQRIKHAHIFLHKNYNNDELWNDIIVIKLEHPADLNGWVTPICLPTGTEQFGTTTEVAGWGYANSSDDSSLQSTLKYVKLPIIDMDVCRMYLELTVNGTKQICAGGVDTYEDSCGGDSGGPLMQIANSEYGPRYYQIGLVSYGQQSCGYAPAIYTRLSAYMDFVLDALSD